MSALLPYLAIVALLVVAGVVSPVPEEALLAATGFAVAHGELALAPALAASILGVLLGDLVIFAGGAAVGRGARAFGARPSAAMRGRAERAIARFGSVAVVLARLVPGLRGAIFFALGGSGTSVRPVIALDLLAAVVHVPIIIALGSVAAHQAPRPT